MQPVIAIESFVQQLHCPIRSGFHPDHLVVARDTLRWGEKMGLFPTAQSRAHLIKTDCARLGAAVYHDGYSREALQLATDFMTWLYLHDDLWVDGTRRDPVELDADHARMLRVLRGEPLEAWDHPLSRALDDICARLAAYRVDLEPFFATVEQYITAKSWECRNHLHGITPEVRLYVAMRAHGGGVEACFELGAIVRTARLQKHLRNHAYLRTLATLSNNLVCWANDLASVGKELEEGTTTNLVMALREAMRVTWPEAMERAVRMWNDAMQSYMRLLDQLDELPLPESDRVEVNKYVTLLGSWIRGNLDYDLVVRRFDTDELSRAANGALRRES